MMTCVTGRSFSANREIAPNVFGIIVRMICCESTFSYNFFDFPLTCLFVCDRADADLDTKSVSFYNGMPFVTS